MAEDVIKIKNAPHLGVQENKAKESRWLYCPDGKHSDNIEVSFYDDKIVYFKLTPTGIYTKSMCDKDVTVLLYSRTKEKDILTMGRYPNSFSIEVYSWKARNYPNKIKDDEKEEIKSLDRINMTNVETHGNNIIVSGNGNLIRVIEEHKKRICGLNLEDISLQGSVNFYNLIAKHAPRP